MVFLRRLICVLLPIIAASAVAQRLPQGVAPSHYALRFTPDLASATFKGEESIQVNVQKATDTITLNSAEIEIQKVVVTQSAAGDGAGASADHKVGEEDAARSSTSQEARVSFDLEKEQVTLTLGKPLAPGPATIHIVFTGILNDKLRGFYLAKTKVRRYATTQFEATDARRAFPSFDEPAFKATFDITLEIDNGDTAISNGKVVSDTPGPGAGKHTVKFAKTPKMSTYLVAMAVGDFVCSEGQADGIPIRVCGTPDKKPLEQLALGYTEEIIKYYNQYFSIPYPYGKLDIVGVPDFEAGAMENTAAIFYRESLLFIDNESPTHSKANVFTVLAHEISHQWFGDLVTMRWWDNLWLNEGFADWMEKKPMQSLHPSFHGELESVKDMGDALRLDSLRNTHPIHVKAETPDEINELFDPISYQKGAAVMRMIEAYLTPEVFRRGINMYLRKFQYGNATAEDFWTTMTQASGRPIDKIMPTFINQPGEPLVTVKAECLATPQATPKKTSRKRRTRRVQPHPKTEITLAQERFSGDGDPGGSSQPWLIPVCIKTNENKPFCQLLGERRQVVPVVGCSSWVFTNTNAVGYYRTQYDANGLGKLAGVATSSLNTAERMALIDDEWALVVSGQEKIGNFLDLVGALNSVPERAVEERYKNSLEYVGHAVTGSGESEPYRSWLQANFRPQLAKIGWTPKADESDDAKQLRADFLELLGIFAKDSETIRQSTTLARQYLKDPRSVDSTLAPAVLGVAAYSGDGSLLNEFINALNHASTPEEYYDIERALSKFRGADAAARILEMSVSAEVRNQDAPQLIGAVLSNAANRDFAWQWIKSHWSEVERKFTGNNGVDVVNGAAGFCDAEHRDDVQKFFTDHKVASSERTLKQISELIDTCTSFRNRQQNNLSVWLGQHAGGAAQGQN